MVPLTIDHLRERVTSPAREVGKFLVALSASEPPTSARPASTRSPKTPRRDFRARRLQATNSNSPIWDRGMNKIPPPREPAHDQRSDRQNGKYPARGIRSRRTPRIASSAIPIGSSSSTKPAKWLGFT